jgi:hypothetical protein
MELFQGRIHTGDAVIDPFLIYVAEEDQKQSILPFDFGQILYNIVESTGNGS